MIRIYKEKLSPYTPSKITAHKTIKTLPTRKGLLAGGNCDAVDNEYDGKRGQRNDNSLITLRRTPGYFCFLWYCVLLQRRRHT